MATTLGANGGLFLTGSGVVYEADILYLESNNNTDARAAPVGLQVNGPIATITLFILYHIVFLTL